MRLIFPATAALLLAACGANPKPVAAPTPASVEAPRRSGNLVGMTASEMIARFGTPRLQVREGDGTKLQFVATACVLDAYLYPPPGGAGLARVTHVDTRNREGRAIDPSGCIATIEAR